MLKKDISVFGLYATRAGAENAMSTLKIAEYDSANISVLFPFIIDAPPSKETQAPKSSAVSAAKGAVVGGVLGSLVGMGLLGIPGVGPFLAAGPVVAALLFASRAGSAITAEIGLMKATEQLDAMEMMAVDPIARVVAPRFWAGVISMPLLAALFSAMGVFGGYLVGVRMIGVDEGSFWSQMEAAVDFDEDVLNGVIKSFVFGVAITWIAVFEGYDAPPTAEGVSGATTRTVVTASLWVLALDFVLTALMFRGN